MTAKGRKLIVMVFAWACFIAVGVCVIVNLAIDGRITWAAYPMLAVPFGWLVLSPLVIRKHGIAISLIAAMIFIFPFLFLLARITPVNDWFVPLGLPSAVVGIIAGWVIYFLFRYLKISPWYKGAIAVFLLGVIADPIINHYVNAYLLEEPSVLNRFINIFCCVAVAAMLGILGYRKNKGVR